jgi:signal peptidase I
MGWWSRRRLRKQAIETMRHAQDIRNLRGDILPAATLERMVGAETDVQHALTKRNWPAVETRLDHLHELLNTVAPPSSHASWRGNLEVLIVAAAVAWGFRTYFLQPFKIPTGSMQPTLYGIHSFAQPGPGILDRGPLRFAKWVVTGQSYREVRAAPGLWDRLPLKLVKWVFTRRWYSTFNERAPLTGPFFSETGDPSAAYFDIGPNRYAVPKDALMRNELLVRPGDYVLPGQLLWRGTVVSGDHLFVNKLAWNFSRPRRGQVIVFSTQAISDLRPGEHYIKRLVGMPGEAISIVPPDVRVDGQPLTEPRPIARIARREGAYAGYSLAPEFDPATRPVLCRPTDVIRLDSASYFVLGDNTGNSRDGRYWGAVPRANLVGPGLVVYWPFSRRWGLVQ